MRIIQPMVPIASALPDGPGPLQAPHKNRFSAQNRMAGSMPAWQAAAPEPAAYTTPETVPTAVPDNEKLGFGDFIDVINPLQHIPLISTLYRRVTGDEIKAPAQIMGGMLFGGPLGAAGAMASVAVQEYTGKSIDETVATLVTDPVHAFKPREIVDLAVTTKDGGQIDTLNSAGSRRHFASQTRMAGTIPVWHAGGVPSALSDDAKFGLLLQRLDT